MAVTPAAPRNAAGKTGVCAAKADLRTLAHASGLSLTGVLCKATFGFLLAVVVTRGLGASQSGVFFSAVALFTILMTLAEAGAQTGLVRTMSRYRALGRAADLRLVLRVALTPVLAIGVLLAGLLFLFAPLLADALLPRASRTEITQYLRLLAVFLPLAAVGHAVLSATRGLGSVRPYVLVENIGVPAVRLVVGSALVAIGFGGAGVAAVWGASLAVGFVVAVALLARMLQSVEAEADAPPGAKSWPRVAADFWRFAAPRGLSSTFQVGVSWLDVLLVAAMRSPREAGIYAAASRGVVVGMLGLQAVRLAIAPQFSALLARGDRFRAEQLYQASTWWLIALSWPPYLALAVFAPLVMAVFGPEFVAGAAALSVLAFAMLLDLSTGNVTTMLLMGGKSGWNLGNTSAALAMNVVLNLLLVPRYGILGAAAAWAVSIGVENALALFQIRWLLGVRPFGRGYPPVAFSALACYGLLGLLIRAVGGASPTTLALALLSGTALYAAVLWRLRATLQLHVLLDGLRRRAASAPREATT